MGIQPNVEGLAQHPDQYWTRGMGRGAWKIENGVVYEHEPQNRARILIPWLSGDDQPDMNIISPPAEDDPDPYGTVYKRKMELAKWLAQYYLNPA
jgi:hypothetical protein